MAHRLHVMICTCTNCISNGAFKIKDALEAEIAEKGLENDVRVVPTGASGLCVNGPILMVQPDGIFYQFLTEKDIANLVEEHFLKGRPVKSLMYVPADQEVPIPKLTDIPFFKDQRLIALRNRGLIDPDNIDEYITRDGYKALAKALASMTSEQVIEEIKLSGLRGRGGGGFPTGKKWEICRSYVLKKRADAPDTTCYVICNADEGDPGAFMDRSIIEADPYSIIEGMCIGAYAIGATQGYIYVRSEYPLAIKRIEAATKQAREYGLLGDNILGFEFSFDLTIFKGAGAFVCGEETSLIRSIEGHAPEPIQKPPYPAESGLWGCPTCINNVETWATVACIINKGSDWFAAIGTEKSKGTKVFSLAGNVNNAGLVEVPMGITLREIVYDIGGGIPKNKKLKAVQTGGPSGGFIPERLLHLPVDYERLKEAGAIMGSGGMIVVDEETCIVDFAKYFLEFTSDESCGKCSSCREGAAAIFEILERICQGEGQEEDMDLLEEISYAVKDASMCGLGQTLPNPVLSSLKYFRDEYIAHIKYKKCPAIVCKKIISTSCRYNCPVNTDVPSFIALIAHGQFEESYEVIRENNPLPILCGYICHHPCEDRCRAVETGGSAIAIKPLKQFVGDYMIKEKKLRPQFESKPPTLEKIAVVGSGPAGLGAAYDLRKLGYDVTVFEQSRQAGGMIAQAIPHFRLPEKVLNLEIELIKEAGVKIQTGSYIGKDISLEELSKEGYRAVLFATGTHKSVRLGIPGEDTEGVIDGLEFLKGINSGKKYGLGKRVGIVGGGNAAIDAARSAWRSGAEKVIIIYRRTQAQMPAIKSEIHEGLEEGIEIQPLTAPVRIIAESGKLKWVECTKMKLGDVDSSGRPKPVPIEGSEFRIELDSLIIAIGQQADVSFLSGNKELELTKWGTIKIDPETMMTSQPGLFACGDVVMGPTTISDAMAHGKKVAQAVHRHLRRHKAEPVCKLKFERRIEPVEFSEEEIGKLERPKMPCLPCAERINNFRKVELAFTEEMAVTEAKRCCRCDLEKPEEDLLETEEVKAEGFRKRFAALCNMLLRRHTSAS